MCVFTCNKMYDASPQRAFFCGEQGQEILQPLCIAIFFSYLMRPLIDVLCSPFGECLRLRCCRKPIHDIVHTPAAVRTKRHFATVRKNSLTGAEEGEHRRGRIEGVGKRCCRFGSKMTGGRRQVSNRYMEDIEDVELGEADVIAFNLGEEESEEEVDESHRSLLDNPSPSDATTNDLNMDKSSTTDSGMGIGVACAGVSDL